MAKKRRALSHVGGKVHLSGDAAYHDCIRRALDVRVSEARVRAHVHGFHPYPARLHPDTARELIEGLSRDRACVLDPFCGSGTVAIEARLLGRKALASDINPLALELSWLKTRGITPKELSLLETEVTLVLETAQERGRAKAGASRRYSDADRKLFAPHVLMELDSLRLAIDACKAHWSKRILRLVLSATLLKVVQKGGASSSRIEAKRHARGFCLRFFHQKFNELQKALEDFSQALPKGAPRAKLNLGDARELPFPDASVDLVVCSPPYAGVFDYVDHHQVTLRWLELSAGNFSRQEIGARRHAKGKNAAQTQRRWRQELGAALGSIARVLKPAGKAALVIADSTLGGRAERANQTLNAICSEIDLRPVAWGRQARPHFHRASARAFGKGKRYEHLVILQRD